MPSPQVYLGINLDRQALHLVAQSDRGEEIAEISRQLPKTEGPEQDPKEWWRLLRTTAKDLMRRSKIEPDHIRGIGITASTEAAVTLNEAKESNCPAILGPHAELEATAHDIQEQFGIRNLRNLTGRSASSSSVLTKLAWIAKNHPRAWHDCRTVLQPADYLRLRLTDQIATDASTASRSILFSPHARNWSPRVIDHVDVAHDWLPTVTNGLQIIGRVTPNAAKECGFSAGTPVAAGANPTCATALALGGLNCGDLVVELGGSGITLAVSSKVRRDSSGRSDVACHCLDDLWVNECGQVADSRAFDWLRNTVLREELVQAKRAKRTPVGHISELAATTSTGADGLMLLDGDQETVHLLNLGPQHGREHLARAVMEAAACSINRIRLHLSNLGVNCERILLHGVGSESDLWCQMVADANDIPVVRNQLTHLASRGAAVMACVAAATKHSLEQSGKAILKQSTTLKPRAAARKAYQELTDSYEAAYSRLDNS